MAESQQMNAVEDGKGGSTRAAGWTPFRAAVLMVAVAVVWLAFDRATKMHFDQFSVGDQLGGPFAGLFEFTLVHNTGAAWGLFSGSTFALGVFSFAVSIVIAAAAVWFAERSNWLLSLGAGLIVAGGIGNAIDRFSQGYVTDFINLSFMEFPVFNIADIGVTCGFVLLAIAIVFFWRDGQRPEDALEGGMPGDAREDGQPSAGREDGGR